MILEVTVADAAAKAGIEIATTHAELGTAITIVGDAAVDDPARAHDPLAGAIAPEMTATVGTVESAQIAETKVVLGNDLLVDSLVPHSSTKTSATVGRYSFNSLPLACEVTSSKNSSRRMLVLLTRLRL